MFENISKLLLLRCWGFRTEACQ